MKRVLSLLIAALIIAAAAIILVRRLVRFIRTRGQSGCENCTWGSCPRCRRH